MIVAPPLLSGAVQYTVARAFPATARTLRGTPGFSVGGASVKRQLSTTEPLRPPYPSTATKYVVPTTGTTSTRLQLPPPASSLVATVVSALTAEPVYTPSKVSKSLPDVSITTVPARPSVNEYQSDAEAP